VEFFRAARYGRALAAIMMDIDHFKAINDSLGHAAGDVVLVQIADIMRECVRESDVIARYGGEEFVILLPETDRDGAMAIAERIRGMIEEASLATGNGEKVRITLSLGLAIMDEENIYPSLDKLLQQADMSLYSAKDTGRNRVVML
jgi:diguanylate cyclase (GGDEF)-like protein